MNNESENKYSFRIKFEKSQHSINAETYVQSLISLSTILREVNYQVGNNEGVGVNVLAQDAGSFDVALEIIELIKNNRSLIVDGATVLSAIVAVSLGIVELKKVFSGADDSKTEIQGDQVNIKDNEGNVIFQTNNVTYNIFKTNQAVNDAISEQFNAIKKDDEVEALTITSGNKEVSISKDEFESLAQKRVVDVGDNDTVEVPAQLTISKIVLDNAERKWEFVYQGSKISAKVSDESFWEKILAGEVSFANGDILVGDLVIKRELDASLGVYLNKEYSVANIRQHLPRVNRKQTSLEDTAQTDI